MKISFPILALALIGPGAFTPAPAAPLALSAGDGARIAELQVAPNPHKPYISQIFTPGAEALGILEDGPADHPHHHGLMFALRVNETDFWSEEKDKEVGSQIPEGPLKTPAQGHTIQQLLWKAADGSSLLRETRKIEVYTAADQQVHWLNWTSSLRPAAGRESLNLSGSHYFGLGLRLRPEFAGNSEFLWENREDQSVVRGDERLTGGGWCAVRSSIGSTPVTVLLVAHPENSRPTRWFTMGRPFSYLSATLNLHETPAKLDAGQEWKLRWGLAVAGGKLSREDLAALAKDWVKRSPMAQSSKNN